jgi:hypothetical protein
MVFISDEDFGGIQSRQFLILPAEVAGEGGADTAQ